MGHAQLDTASTRSLGPLSDADSDASGSTSSTGLHTQVTTELPRDATEDLPQSTKQSGREDDREHRFGTAALIGLCIGVVLLVVSGCLFVDRPTEQATPATSLRTSAPPSTTAPPTTAPATTSTRVPPAGRLGIGVALGKVIANDGTTLVVKNLTGSTVRVRSNTATKTYVLSAARAADISVGTVVAVYGQTQSDKSIMASVITGIWVNASPR